ncbi:MAG: HEAT repeat domain-containing protein, partial [Planctomycetota bacterium]
ATYREVFPISQPHPWRAARGSQEAWLKFYGKGEATPNGSFTAACSPTFYRGSAFPEEYHGNLFTCESQQNLVNRSIPARDGAKIHLRRPEGFANREFLASTEGWFRPVNLETGPDGALYVVDMYREIIEDYSAIPRYLQQQYGLDEGNERGRIWRVVHEDAPTAKTLNLENASIEALVAAISHRNAVWRRTAQRLLVERDDITVSPRLEDVVRGGETPQAKIHALYTLEGLGAVASSTVMSALDEGHYAVRWHALRLAGPLLDESEDVLDVVAEMVNDPNALVRLQLALTLGESKSDRARAALARLARTRIGDPWMRAAIMSSVGTSAGPLLRVVLTRGEKSAHPLLDSLCRMVGVRRDDAEVGKLLQDVAELTGNPGEATQRAALEALLVGLGSKRSSHNSKEGRQALGRLLSSDSSEVAVLAYKVAQSLRVENLPEVDRLFEAAIARTLDETLPPDRRRAAIELLARAPFASLKPVAARLLDARQPVEIQLATVATLDGSNDPAVGPLLLKNWEGYSPGLRAAVIQCLFSQTNRLSALLDALESKRVLPRDLDSFRRLQLLEHSDEAIRARASKRLKRDPKDEEREKVLETYRRALGGERNAERGKDVFAKNCSSCHKAGQVGHDVGPALASAIGRPDESLLVEILDPNRTITEGYRTYTVVTSEGRVFTGILASETATSV